MAASAVSRLRKARVAAFLIDPILPNQKDRRVNVAREIVLRVIGLSAPVLRATALSANAMRGTGLVVRAPRGMDHSAIKENSVVGLQTAGVQGRIVLGQRLSLVRGIALRK